MFLGVVFVQLGLGCCSQRPSRVCFPSLRARDVPTEVTEFPYVYSTLVFINLQQFLISSPQYIILFFAAPKCVSGPFIFPLFICLSCSPIPADKNSGLAVWCVFEACSQGAGTKHCQQGGITHFLLCTWPFMSSI